MSEEQDRQDREDEKNLRDEKINSLMEEFVEHRLAIKDMIVDLEKIRVKIDKLIPDAIDARFMRFFEEKVKSVTALFNSLLDMRKEIGKSIKDEIEIRRKITNREDEFDISEMIDVREMADTIEKFKDTTTKEKNKRIAKNKEQVIGDDIDIPGLTSEIGGKISD